MDTRLQLAGGAPLAMIGGAMRGPAKLRGISAHLVSTLLLTLGCTGNIGAAGAPTTPGTTPSPAATPSPRPTTPALPLGDAFAIDREQIMLLPFAVRLAKLAAIAQVAVDDPVLAPVVEARLALGDHDYAHGIAADRTWTASKLSAWVAALRPLCASTAFRARFPALPEQGLDALIEAAYGRAADAEDRALIAEALAEVPAADAEMRATAVCLAVLSSTELVAQ